MATPMNEATPAEKEYVLRAVRRGKGLSTFFRVTFIVCGVIIGGVGLILHLPLLLIGTVLFVLMAFLLIPSSGKPSKLTPLQNAAVALPKESYTGDWKFYQVTTTLMALRVGNESIIDSNTNWGIHEWRRQLEPYKNQPLTIFYIAGFREYPLQVVAGNDVIYDALQTE